jgi:myosin heavy subunit
MGKQNPQSNRNVDPDLASIGSADISFDEQIEIIGQINEVLEKNRIEITPDTFAFTPKKQGNLIPLLINAGAVLILLAGAFSLLSFFNREERSLIRQSSTVLSAEGKLIEALRQESEERLNQKDQQIAEIQGRLEDLRTQAETAKLDTEAKILEREVQLRAELEAELAAERQKLQAEGLSAVAINNQLRTLEERLTTENQSQLTTFRLQSEEELAEKEAELAALEEQYRQSLLQFQQERESLEQQFSEREVELRAQLEQQAAQAESAQAEVADQLTQLREQRQREQLVFDQILSSYNRVEVSIENGQYSAAQEDLDNLESYLSQAAITSLPAVQNRIPVDRFLIASLRRLIEVQSTANPEASARVREAEPSQAEDQSSSNAAKSLQAELDRTRATLNQRTRDLNRTKTTLDQRTRELNQAQATISRQSQQISRSDAAQREIAAHRQEVSSLRQRYGSINSSGSDRVSQQKVLDLVDTKLQVREVLSSDSVRSEYPNLYDAMEEYFDTYGKVQTQSGQEEALKDAIAVLDDLLGTGSRANLSSMKSSYTTGNGDLFAQFLAKLEALLE